MHHQIIADALPVSVFKPRWRYPDDRSAVDKISEWSHDQAALGTLELEVTACPETIEC